MALAGCGAGSAGGSGGGDWYYHFACNGDPQCLATNPLGTPSGTIDEGPVESNCRSLQRFRTQFWGPASWDDCDHIPTFTLPGTGTPSITALSTTVGVPGTQVTITGTNFPTNASDVTLDIGGVTLPASTTTVSTAGNTTITFTVPNIPSVSGPITVHTPGGQATSSASFTVRDDLAAVAWSGTKFVAVGAFGTALTSPDGLHWTPQPTGVNPLLGSLYSVTWSGSRFIAGGSNGYLISSPDGAGWSGPASGLRGVTFQGIASSGSQYVAVGSASGLALSSDATTWSMSTFGQAADSYDDVIWADGQFVAAGYQILSSPDGITWTQRVAPTFRHHGLAWNGSTFVAVGDGGAVRTSPDGATWTLRTSGTTASLRHVTWFNGRFVAVGAAGTIVTSPDGVAWTTRATGAGTTLNGVAASATAVVAVGNAGVTISSSDGIDWTSNLPPAPAGVSGRPGITPTLSWSPVPGATSYVVYASSSSAVSGSSYLKRVITTGTSAQVTGITSDGVWWYFVVAAVNEWGEGPPSVVVPLCTGTHICG